MVEIEHTITIKTKHHVLDLTMEEAIDLKDALIRAIGAQTRPEKKKEQGQVKTMQTCHCGSAGWGANGCCGVSGCSNVPA